MLALKSTKIYQELKKLINSNDIKTGDYLPSEQQLCIKYNVARETIRKVYAMLEREGLLISIKNHGRIKRREHFVPSLESFKNLTHNDFRSVYEIIEKTDEVLRINIKRYHLNENLFIYAESKIYLNYLDLLEISNEGLNKYGIMFYLKKYSKNGINGAVKRIVIDSDYEPALKYLKTTQYVLNDCLVFDNYENVVEHSKNYYKPNLFEYFITEKNLK